MVGRIVLLNVSPMETKKQRLLQFIQCAGHVKENKTAHNSGNFIARLYLSLFLRKMGCGAVSMATQDQTKAHSAQCFVVACMDFRLVDDTVHFMNGLGYNNNYDQFVLAGSSLGFTQDKYPQWGEALLDHMSIGQGLHGFREIIFIDHKDCGAFKKFYPGYKPQEELELHTKHMQMTNDKLAMKFPNFKFRGYIMDIHGKCEEIKVVQKAHIDPSKVKEDNFLATLHLEE